MSEDLTQKFNGSQDDKLNQIIAMVRAMSSDVQDVKTRLSVLEQKVEDRLYDTRPLWEGVQAQLTELKAEVDKGFRRVERRLDVVSVDMNKLRSDLFDHEDRIEKLEGTR